MPSSTTPEAIFQRLLTIETLARFPDKKALQGVATLIDLSADLRRDDGNDKALSWCDELESRPLKDSNVPLLDYYRANAWHNRQRIKHQDADVAWSWEQPETLEQIRFLRRAVRHPEFENLDAVRQSQIFTNLANQLNSLGRLVEAVSMWNRALEANPRFGMSLGNRGMGLSEYGRHLYDSGQQAAFLVFAHRDLSSAISDRADYAGYLHDDAKEAFTFRRANIERLINVAKVAAGLQIDGYSFGDTNEERAYREWVLAEGLFLNPLNDLGKFSISARDNFGLPDFVTDIDESPTLIGFFNQMKQEYTSARWMLYDGIQADQSHFADRDVLLYNTLDFPSYSLAVEKVKAAFRIAYSLFDKIAFFLNDYAKLNINPKQVYFRTLWYKNLDARRGLLRSEFRGSRNWPLRGLFWVAKDLFDPELESTAEPDAQQLYLIRNSLEHSYLKVHEILVPSARKDLWLDRLAYSIQREDFNRKTLRVMRLARAAMIYLSLAMHHEEQQRPKKDSDRVMPMLLDVWQDEWKV